MPFAALATLAVVQSVQPVDRVAETSDFDQKLADPPEGPAQIEAPGSDE